MKHALLALLLLTLAVVGGPHVASAGPDGVHHMAMTSDGDCAACPEDASDGPMGHTTDGCANAFGCAVFVVPAASDFFFAVDLIDRGPAQRGTPRFDSADIPLILPPPRV